MSDDKKPGAVRYGMLARVAERAVSVVALHQNVARAIATFHATLPTQVAAYLALLQAVAALTLKSRELNRVAKARVATLHGQLVGWAGLLARDVAGFVSSEFTDGAGVPADVLRKAATLTGLARTHEREGRVPLPYADDLATELDASSDEAREASEAAQLAMTELQERRRELNASAGALHRELVTLRRVLRATLGSSHRDYQKLRMARTRREELEDEELESALAESPEGESPAGSPTWAADGEQGAA